MRTQLLVATLAALLLAGCAVRDEGAPASAVDPNAPTPGVMVVDTPVPERPASEFTTAILEDGTYQHERLEIAPQTTVIWWNVDDLTHSVVSDEGRFAGSGPIPPGGEFVRTFISPGEYTYHCRYHPDMKATIVVQAS